MPSSSEIEAGHHLGVQQILLNPGESVGLHRHPLGDKEEVYVLGTGQVILNQDGKEEIMALGETYFIPSGTKHNLTNTGQIVAQVFSIHSFHTGIIWG